MIINLTMDLSTSPLQRFGGLFLVVMCAAGCSQPGAAGLGSPTEPGILSGSAAPSARSGALNVQSAAPVPSYNVNARVWSVQVQNRPDEDESFFTITSQDSAGNITFEDEDRHPVTLTRVGGSGPVVIFDARFALAGDPGECDTLMTGKARLSLKGTGGMVITMSLHGLQNDCKNHSSNVTLELAP